MLKHTFTALILLLLFAASVPAEVGTTTPDGGTSGMADFYILSHIFEDPDPVNHVWKQFNSNGPNRVVLNPEGEVNGDGVPSVVLCPPLLC